LNPDQIRQNRITLLRKYYVKSCYNDTVLIHRAMEMGVLEKTAKSYLATIKAQLHR